MTNETTTFQALHYWQGVSIAAAGLYAAGTMAGYDMGETQAAMLLELAERARVNARVLLQSIEYDQPGGLREKMTVVLVNHGDKAKARESVWDTVPRGVISTLEMYSDTRHGHLSDDYSLHS